MSTQISKELRIIATTLASNADDGNDHSESKVLREAARLLDEASRFITGFAGSAEFGFARRRAADRWLSNFHYSRVLSEPK
jgi:hypothetical protein